PIEDLEFVEKEIAYWMSEIISRNWKKISRKIETAGMKLESIIAEQLSGLGIDEQHIYSALQEASFGPLEDWGENDFLSVSIEILRKAKPFIIAANKADIADKKLLEELKKKSKYPVVAVSADYELALVRAAKSGLIKYIPGNDDFEIIDETKLNQQQKKALLKIKEFIKINGGTGVQKVLEELIFNQLNMIAVYPVEDENHWTDKSGNVLPDVFLMPSGSKAIDLAFKVHTDLGNNFIRAIDAKKKFILGKDYELKDGDIIKIIAKL
ncbi:MAG: TGS domain-containing protein, partial [Thermoplasmata archaeon]